MAKRKASKRKIKFVKKYISLYKIILPSLFVGLLVVGMVVSLIIPLRPKYSQLEKRNLSEFPSFSFSSLLDSSYFKGIDKWFSDTFPFREKLISANASLKEMRGFGNTVNGFNDNIINDNITDNETDNSNEVPAKPEDDLKEPELPDQLGEVTQKLSNIVAVGKSAYEYCSFNKSVADDYVSVVNRTAEGLDGLSKVYCMLVPTSIDITLSDRVRKNINTCDQSQGMDYIYGALNQKTVGVNIFKTMRMNRDKYIYYRTDHHWTALGAYYAYCELMNKMGQFPFMLKSFRETSYGEFLGSFYSETNSTAMKNSPDELIAYLPLYDTTLKYTDSYGRVIDWRLVNNVSDYPLSQKYSAFAAGDNPYTVIENLDTASEKSCLVIKESFGNAVVPYIAGHYKTVHVIDYRYYKEGFIGFAQREKIDDVIFINNMSAVRASNLIDKMNAIAF